MDSLKDFELFFEDVAPPNYIKKWLPKKPLVVMLSKLKRPVSTAKQ